MQHQVNLRSFAGVPKSDHYCNAKITTGFLKSIFLRKINFPLQIPCKLTSGIYHQSGPRCSLATSAPATID